MPFHISLSAVCAAARRSTLLFSTLLVALLLFPPPQPVLAQTADCIRYVNDDALPGGDGLSWQSPYQDLQSALASVEENASCQIWVAEGTYNPSTADRSASFVLQNGVSIYGGFAGTETTLAERDWKAHPTVLSGDLLGDDTYNYNSTLDGYLADRVDNSYHIVSGTGLDASAVLDGFTVQRGAAQGTTPETTRGAGLYLEGSPTLSHLVVYENIAADLGGGSYLSGSPTLREVSFIANLAIRDELRYEGSGGGMYVVGDPVMVGVSWIANQSVYGGGLYVNGSPTVVNSLFYNNLE